MNRKRWLPIVLAAVFAVPRTQMDSTRPIPYFIYDGRGTPGFDSADRQLAVWALNAWSRESGGKLRFVEVKDEAAALVRLRWVSAREGLFGETQRIRVGDKQGAVVFVMPEVANLGQPLAGRAKTDNLLRDSIVYLTCVHELGHAIGLEHTRDFQDIMYSFGYGGDIVAYFMRYRDKLKSREDIAKFSGLSPADATELRSLYSGGQSRVRTYLRHHEHASESERPPLSLGEVGAKRRVRV